MNELAPTRLPPRDCIVHDKHWRVAHAFGSALAGWLVIVSRRHITSLSEMTAPEAETLGFNIRKVSAALESVTGAQKCYVIFLAESPGFQHVHVHIIPRLPDAPPDRVGIGAMQYLAEPQGDWVSADEMDRISAAVRQHIMQRVKENEI